MAVPLDKVGGCVAVSASLFWLVFVGDGAEVGVVGVVYVVNVRRIVLIHYLWSVLPALPGSTRAAGSRLPARTAPLGSSQW